MILPAPPPSGLVPAKLDMLTSEPLSAEEMEERSDERDIEAELRADEAAEETDEATDEVSIDMVDIVD